MSIIGIEGFDNFETNNTNLQLNQVEGYVLENPYDTGMRIVNNGRFGDGKWMKIKREEEFRINTAGTGITTTMYVSFAVRFDKKIDGTKFLYFYNSGDIGHVWIKLTTIGKLKIKTGNGDILGYSTNTFNLNVWYWIEVKTVISDTGSVDIKVDGVDWLNVTGDTKVGTSANISHIAFAGGASDLHIDDIVWQDGSGAYLGDSKVEGLMPVGDATLSWNNTGSGAHWTDVATIGSAIDDEYVYTASNGVERYYYDTITADSEVHAVAIKYRARRDDTGSRSIQSSHSATGANGATRILHTDWLFYSDIFENDGSVDWTQTSIGNTHFGMEDVT